jgi:hypothetical protein
VLARATTTSPPINLVESMKAMFQQIQEQELADHKRMIEWGRRMERRRKKDPERFEAEMQASLEIFGRIGDPVNPVIAHPKQVKRFEARVEELVGEPQPFRAGG